MMLSLWCFRQDLPHFLARVHSAPPSFTQASESQAVESCESFLLARCSHNFFGPVRLSVTGLFEKKIRTSNQFDTKLKICIQRLLFCFTVNRNHNIDGVTSHPSCSKFFFTSFTSDFRRNHTSATQQHCSRQHLHRPLC